MNIEHLINKLNHPSVFFGVLGLLPSQKVENVGERAAIFANYEVKRTRLAIAQYVPYILTKLGKITKETTIDEDMKLLRESYEDFIKAGFD